MGELLRTLNVEKWRSGSFRSLFRLMGAGGLLFPRELVFWVGFSFLSLSVLVRVCLNSKRGSPLGSRKADTQRWIVFVLTDVLGKHRAFVILVSPLPRQVRNPLCNFFLPTVVPPNPHSRPTCTRTHKNTTRKGFIRTKTWKIVTFHCLVKKTLFFVVDIHSFTSYSFWDSKEFMRLFGRLSFIKVSYF